MTNMSYIRFENTERDLRDCIDHVLDDLSTSPREEAARVRLSERACQFLEMAVERDDILSKNDARDLFHTLADYIGWFDDNDQD